MTDKSESFECWAVVEIMGHDRYAGKVTEQAVGGCSFVRVDVPELNGSAAFTKLFGQSAIFSITPVTREIALEKAKQFRAAPVQVYGMSPQRSLPFERESWNDQFDDEEREMLEEIGG